MGGGLQSLTSGKPRAASVPDLEEELSALWRSASEGSEGEGAVTRACALTLLIYAESEEAAREVSNLVSEVTRQNPCRAIIIVEDPKARAAEMTAWISAHCNLPAAGDKQVCCEQVTVLARGESVMGLESVVVPLTVSGLPVHLWWRARQFNPPEYFGQILRASNRVMVDSGRFANPRSDLQTLAARAQNLSGRPAVIDLNWVRLTPWRELIAQCFDSSETRPLLGRLCEARFEFERESVRKTTQETQSLLLAGWLASRLGWESVGRSEARDEEGLSLRFKRGAGEKQIQLVPCRFEGAGSGVCLSIAMKSDGASPAVFSLRRGTDAETVRESIEISGRPAVTRTVRLQVSDEVEVVNEELKFLGRDRVFEEALAMVARMTS